MKEIIITKPSFLKIENGKIIRIKVLETDLIKSKCGKALISIKDFNKFN